MIIAPYKVRIFNIEPEPIEYTSCATYKLKQIEIKESVDIRDTDSPVDDQGYLGSCAANAVVNSYENLLNRFQKEKATELSRLFVYYNAREIEKNVMEDFGVMYLSNALQSLKTYGVCPEDMWPYDVSRFAMKPSDQCYESAKTRKILDYEYIFDVIGMKEVLSINKPVVIGMKVFESFMFANKNNYVIPLPQENELFLGGHAVSVVGYTKENQFIIKNSFGLGWGDKGYALIPLEYMEKYVFDRWNLILEEESTSVDDAVVSSTNHQPKYLHKYNL